MTKQSPLTAYLTNYGHAHTLPEHLSKNWNHVLILPLCGEAEDCITQLLANVKTDQVLVIACLNRPEGLAETGQWQLANEQILAAMKRLAQQATKLVSETDGYLLEFNGYDVWFLNYNNKPFADNQGVGLARKIAADTASQLIQQGRVNSPWIYSSDADVMLPPDYFLTPDDDGEVVAYSLPFEHCSEDSDLAFWQSLYDFKLHYYRQGVRYIGAQYDYIPLGSCLIVHADGYARVRGFPRKSGGEDFYLLNKLAKLGAIAQPQTPLITIRCRYSKRVPFGTGPALIKMTEQQHQPLFYQPQVFAEIKIWRQSLLDFYETAELPENSVLNQFWNTAKVLVKARLQSKSPQRWQQFVHEWFDAFKILKSVHALEADYPRLSLAELKYMDLFHVLTEGLVVPEWGG